MKPHLKKTVESLMMGPGKNGFFLLRFFLHSASICSGGAVKLRTALFNRQILKSKRLPCTVISIGNLTMGGTGKTPMTIYVAHLVQRLGYRPAVVSRGYKGRREKSGGIVSDGIGILLKAEDSGDEAFMLARELKNIPVLVGQNRFRSGMQAISRFKANVIILDDGFQHLKLKRDIDLVLLDDTRPLGNGYLFPRGILREPVSALKRAGAVIFTRCSEENKEMPPCLPTRLRHPFFRSFHTPYVKEIVRASAGMAGVPDNGPSDDFSFLSGCKAVVFSGIAKNNEFCRMVEDLGCQVTRFASFPDHHWYCPEDFRFIRAEIEKTGVELLITTDKDYARIEGKFTWPVDLVVMGIKISLKDQKDAFSVFLEKRLAEIHINKQPSGYI